MALRLIKNIGTKRVNLSDGSDYIDLKQSMSKRDFISLMEEMGIQPDSDSDTVKLSLSQAASFQERLFAIFCVGWSLDAEPIIENYLDLDRASADEVDSIILDHFKALMPSKDELGKQKTSHAGRRKA